MIETKWMMSGNSSEVLVFRGELDGAGNRISRNLMRSGR